MKTSVTSSSSGGVGFLGLLTIAFIILKLTEVISWSWLWVLAPLWIMGGLGILVIALVVVIACADRR